MVQKYDKKVLLFHRNYLSYLLNVFRSLGNASLASREEMINTLQTSATKIVSIQQRW